MSKKKHFRLAVWQFVRIMVALEDMRVPFPIYSHWKEAWDELDKELTKLRETDHSQFAVLMMEQDVVLELYNSQSSRDTRTVLDKVIQLINNEIKAIENKSQEKNNLRFELSELVKTRELLK